MIFSSIFYRANVIWDKRLDFLKEVLVAPINRSTAFFGKVLGGATDSVIQATIIMLLAPLVGVPFGVGFLIAYLFIFITLVGLVGVGLIIGAWMVSPEGFSLLGGFVTFFRYSSCPGRCSPSTTFRVGSRPSPSLTQ